MSQVQTLQQSIAELKTQQLTASEKLRLLYAENLLAASEKQSANACEQSFKKISQLLQTKAKSNKPKVTESKAYTLLHSLNHYLNQSLPTLRKSQQRLSFNEQFQAEATSEKTPQGFADLQSKRAYLSMQQSLFAEQIVQEAIEQGPENPGPLNPQQLAINALKNMRDLSPAYLNRYVNFVDSLFALEQIDKQLAKDNKSSKT